MKRRPNPRQRVLRYLEKFWATYGYPPTLWEITRALNYANPAVVRYHLRALREEGKIEWQDGGGRTIRPKERAK